MIFDEIIELINDIGRLHQRFSEEFFEKHDSYNLKKKRVDSVLYKENYDEKFITLVDDYIEELAFWQIFLEFDSNSPMIETRFRGKNKESALNKLYYYRFGRNISEIPIQKCLNDLLGFRIVIDGNVDYEQLLADIRNSDALEVELFRPYVRKDKDYMGIHLYFKSGQNQYFPWELQIWEKSDEILNEKSHRDHKEKRKYIRWTEIYKGNKHREE